MKLRQEMDVLARVNKLHRYKHPTYSLERMKEKRKTFVLMNIDDNNYVGFIVSVMPIRKHLRGHLGT